MSFTNHPDINNFVLFFDFCRGLMWVNPYVDRITSFLSQGMGACYTLATSGTNKVLFKLVCSERKTDSFVIQPEHQFSKQNFLTFFRF